MIIIFDVCIKIFNLKLEKIYLFISSRNSNFGKISQQFLRMGALDPKTTPRSNVYIYVRITLF